MTSQGKPKQFQTWKKPVHADHVESALMSMWEINKMSNFSQLKLKEIEITIDHKLAICYLYQRLKICNLWYNYNKLVCF